MKALTLHQPWASLIAMGVKTIETRSWSTSYRGPLAIHAGAQRPPLMHLPPLRHHGTLTERDEHNHQTWLVIDTITDPAFQGPLPESKRVPKRAQTPTLFFPARGPHGRPHVEGTPATAQGTAVYLPLGAIVATCELVDVVPIVGPLSETGVYPPDRCLIDPGAEFGLRWSEPVSHAAHGWQMHHCEDQRPYGDFTPGRFAYLLTDIKPIDPPVTCKGRQGLWEWAQ